MQTVNGVDIQGLQQAIQTLRSQPELAKFKFRATNRWLEGTHNRAFVQPFYGLGREDDTRKEPKAYDLDEPPVLLGSDQGPNPVEFVLVALSGCLTTTLVVYAAAQGIALRSVESQYEGELDLRGLLGISPDVRNGYQNIRVTFIVDADADEATIRELVELAQKRSPVFDIVTHQVPVHVDCKKK